MRPDNPPPARQASTMPPGSPAFGNAIVVIYVAFVLVVAFCVALDWP